jgi:hypothetical protein
MPKPSLNEQYSKLENDIIETLIAGHKEWRPDLDYPESYSDMQGAVRGLLRMFEVKRRPISLPMKEMLSEHDKNCDCGHCSK